MEIESLKGSKMMEWLTGEGSALVAAASATRFPAFDGLLGQHGLASTEQNLVQLEHAAALLLPPPSHKKFVRTLSSSQPFRLTQAYPSTAYCTDIREVY